MTKAHILPGTIKIDNNDLIIRYKTFYLLRGCSEYASTIYAEEEFYEMCLRILERRKENS